ncbi:hypothetical protein KUCAC02_037740 [Chaenocephalus aceratus]|nr:hypothetical protein KUCAC02_037740 [Chaenocephalus aceratus]
MQKGLKEVLRQHGRVPVQPGSVPEDGGARRVQPVPSRVRAASYANANRAKACYANVKRAKACYANANRAKACYANAYRAKACYANAYRAKPYYANPYRVKASYANAYRAKARYANAYRVKASYANAYRAKARYANAYRAKPYYANPYRNYHHRIRQECADYMRTNRCNFEPFVEGSFEKYLQRLEDPKETVGQVEIKALSQLYRESSHGDACAAPSMVTMTLFTRGVTPPPQPSVSCEYCALIGGAVRVLRSDWWSKSKVFSFEEAELCQAMEAFRVGGRRYRNSPSVCSDADFGYDTPEDRREESDPGGAVEEKRAVPEDTKPPAEAPPPSRLSLPYKVMKSLDGEVYRNLEFDVWQDNCKEMQKTEYMVFAGRQYFLGDKCQVRLEPKGKFYNAFIQEVGTNASAVTVFIEELGDKHLVQLTDLKPVNPVPAWNMAAPPRKGDMGAMTYDPYAPPHHHHPPTRPPRYGASRSSTRFLNRHLIGPHLTYYHHPGRRYYQDYENYAFRSR